MHTLRSSLVLSLCILLLPAFAEAQSPPALLTPAASSGLAGDQPAAPAGTRRPTVVRERPVGINFDLLPRPTKVHKGNTGKGEQKAAAAALQARLAHRRFSVDLFDNVRHTIVIDEVVAVFDSAGRCIETGHVLAVGQSVAIVVGPILAVFSCRFARAAVLP